MAHPAARAVLDVLETRRSHMVDLLVELARIETPSGDRAAQRRILPLLEEELGNAGLDVTRVRSPDGGEHLLGTQAGDGPGTQLLLGHCDTVWPTDTIHRMPVIAEDETVRGPGVYDMKSGLVMMVSALTAVRHLGLRPGLDPVVFVNSDEEVGSPGSTVHIADLAARSERAFVMEPSLGPSGRLKTRRKGGGVYTVEVRGRAAHAGIEPAAGASAIRELSDVVQRLFAMTDPARGITVNVGEIDGGMRPNVVAPVARAVVDVRVPDAASRDELDRKIRSLTAVTEGTEVSVKGGMGRPPMEHTARNRELWAAAVEHGRVLGFELGEGTSGGTSDANTTTLHTATLDGLGAVGGGAHAAHEFVWIDSLVERAALLALLLTDPARSGDAPHDRGPPAAASLIPDIRPGP